MKKLKIKCNICKDIIIGIHHHELLWCKCRSIFVDGDSRVGGNLKNVIKFNDRGEEFFIIDGRDIPPSLDLSTANRQLCLNFNQT